MRKLKTAMLSGMVLAGMVLAATLWVAAPAHAKIVNRIVAKVNDKIITERELDEAISAYEMRQAQVGDLGSMDKKESRSKMLDRLIEEMLLTQEGTRQGIQARDKEIEEVVRDKKSQFPSEEYFEQALKRQGLTLNQYRNFLRNQMVVKKLIDKDVRQNLDATDAELQTFYEANKKDFKESEQVHARHILIKVDRSLKGAARDKEETRAMNLIHSIQAQLKQGGSFEELARTYSQDEGTRDKGGDLGFFPRKVMVKEFDRAAFAESSKTGMVIGPVETVMGFHLIQIVERKPERILDLSENITIEGNTVPVKDYVKNALLQQKLQTELEKYVKALKDKAVIEIVGVN